MRAVISARRGLIAAVLAVAVITWLIVQAWSVDDGAHDRFLLGARAVARHDLDLDRAVLRARLEVDDASDAVASAKSRRDASRSSLDATPPDWFGDASQRFQETMKRLDSAIAAKDAALDAWKESVAALRDARENLPLICAQVATQAREATDQRVLDSVAQLLSAVLAYEATPDDEHHRRLTDRVKQVVDARAIAAADLADDLSLVAAQGRVFTDRVREVERLTATMAASGTRSAVDGLLDIYRDAWNTERDRREAFRRVLYLTFGLVVLVGTWFLTKVRTASLATAKRSLEDRIRARTSELEASNRELENEVGERRRVEDELRAARDDAQEATEAKSRFLANMSHELRTPLNAVIGYSELLTEEAEDEGAEHMLADLHKIRGAGKHLLELINGVLDLSKIEVGKMEVFPEEFGVAEMLTDTEDLLKPLADKSGNMLEVRCDDVGTMFSDVTKIRQIIYNLVSNAAKFTEKGRITVTADRVQRASGDRIRFCVKDSGIGMSEAQVAKVFDAFAQADSSTTRNFGGTGLGLTICREFCFLLGGAIDVESEEGRGTTFMVAIPAKHDESKRRSRSRSVLQPSPLLRPPERTVLVIDEDPAAREVIVRAVEREGWYGLEASSGEDGVALAREVLPAAVTVDVRMTDLDGWDVLERLQSDPTTATIPVIMITVDDGQSRAFSLGASAFLTKPVDRLQLMSALERCLPEGKGTVLVVDDEEVVRETTRSMLSKEGYTVVCAEDGGAGLEAVAESSPDLVLLDLMMPKVDGCEFARRLRTDAAHANLPMVVLTSKSLTPEDHARLNDSVQAAIQRQGASDGELAQILRHHIEDATSA